MRNPYILAIIAALPVIGQEQTVILKDQPTSPLEIVSMRPRPAPARPPNAPPQWSMLAWDITVRNRTNSPIMMWTINHVSLANSTIGTCASRMFFGNEPALRPDETKVIDSILHREGPTITPHVDLVVLQDGSYFGPNNCRNLDVYRTQVQERESLMRAILRRLDRDGLAKTSDWMKAELNVGLGNALSDPKKLK